MLFSNLNHWPIPSHSCDNGFAVAWVLTEGSFSIYSFFSCRFHHLSMKRTIKFLHHLHSLKLSLCDFIKFLLHIGSETIIHNISKILIQKVSYNHSNIGWEHFLLFSSRDLFSFGSRDFAL